MKKIRENKNKLVILGLLIMSVLFVVGAYYIYVTVPAVKNQVTLATTIQPETFTELYFDNHLKLPSIIEPGKTYSFSFTTHNLENKTMKYDYLVYLQTIDKKIVLDKNTFTLNSNQYKSISEEFGPLKNIHMKIVVELINKNQVIDFWMGGPK